jgi:NADPH2:quinone reductase
LMRKRLTLRGTVLRSRLDHEKATAMDAFGREVVPLLARGAVRPVVERTFALEQAAEAYDLVRSNRTFGKVILTPGG